MDAFEKAMLMAEEVNSDETWTRLEKYESMEYFSESDVEINLNERTIGDVSGNVSTIGEDNSQYIQFIMDRYADGVDLTTMLIQVQYRLENGQESVSGPVNAYASESRIRFGWPISRIATQEEQTIQFIVFCTGNRQDGEPYVLKTKPIKYKIEFTLGIGGTIIAPDEDWFLQFENVMNEKLNQVAGLTEDAIDSAAGAKESEQNAAQSASTASTLASQVQSNTTQAKASADAAKVSEQNAKASEDAARVYAGNASAVANVQIGTSDTAGLLRGGDIYVDESGALKIITETSETTMPNSYNGRLLVEEIGGVSEQNTTSGKNLWSYGDIKAGAGSDIEWNVPAGTYTFSSSNSSPNLTIRVIYTDDSSEVITVDGLTKTFTLGKVVHKFNFNNPSENSITNIQVESGTVATAYEPYTGGIPSPNPSYPQEIKKTVVSEIKTHGKNFLNARLNVEIGNSDLYTIYDIKAGDALTLYLKQQLTVLDPNYPAFQHYYWFYNKNNEVLKKGTVCYLSFESVNQIKEIVSKLTAPEGTSYMQLNLGSYFGSSGSKAKTLEAQVEKSTEFTGYEPYTESVITLSQPIDLYGMGDVQDILTKQIGRKFGAKVFNGGENWKASGTIERRYYTDNLGCKNYGRIFCTHAKGVLTASEKVNECHLRDSSNGRLLINTDFATVDEWKAHLATNPMTVVYELAEEVIEELPLADQIALNSLKTYDGITYLEFDSEIKPTFKGEYGTSKVGGYTLEALLTARNNEMRITAMETADQAVE